LADNCMYAKAFVMIDPVDGLDPFGMVHSEDLITPGKKLNFTIPALILDNGLDPQGVRAFKSVPCMPLKLGSPRWYNAWSGPIWHVNATAYGHVDCLNDAMIKVGGLVCKATQVPTKLYTVDISLTQRHFSSKACWTRRLKISPSWRIRANSQLTLFSNMIGKANNPLKRNAQTNQDPLQKLLLCSDGELLCRLPLLCMANLVRRAALCLKGHFLK